MESNESSTSNEEEMEIIEPKIQYGEVALKKGPDYYNYQDYEIEWE